MIDVEPPSEKVTLNDQLVFEAAAPNIKIRDAMSPIDGRFCYIYE
jgi:hypothetical protein